MPIVESLITALIVLGALAYLYKAFRPKANRRRRVRMMAQPPCQAAQKNIRARF